MNPVLIGIGLAAIWFGIAGLLVDHYDKTRRLFWLTVAAGLGITIAGAYL